MKTINEQIQDKINDLILKVIFDTSISIDRQVAIIYKMLKQFDHKSHTIMHTPIAISKEEIKNDILRLIWKGKMLEKKFCYTTLIKISCYIENKMLENEVNKYF